MALASFSLILADQAATIVKPGWLAL